MSDEITATQPEVLLLHGWGGSSEQTWEKNGWTSLLRQSGRTSEGIDLVGHGSAPKPVSPDAYADLAEPVIERIREIGHPVDIVGFSLGAKVALDVARRLPQQVRKLVLLGMGDNVFGRERSDAVIAAIREPSDPAHSALSRALAAEALAPGKSPDALIACLQRPANPVFGDADLGAVSADVMLIAGSEDTAFLGYSRLMSALPHANSVVIDGVDHLGTPASSRVQRRALDFLTSILTG